MEVKNFAIELKADAEGVVESPGGRTGFLAR